MSNPCAVPLKLDVWIDAEHLPEQPSQQQPGDGGGGGAPSEQQQALVRSPTRAGGGAAAVHCPAVVVTLPPGSKVMRLVLSATPLKPGRLLVRGVKVRVRGGTAAGKFVEQQSGGVVLPPLAGNVKPSHPLCSCPLKPGTVDCITKNCMLL